MVADLRGCGPKTYCCIERWYGPGPRTLQLKFGGRIPGYASMGLYMGFFPSFIHKAFSSMVCVVHSSVMTTKQMIKMHCKKSSNFLD